MRIIYLGSGQFGIESLNALADSSHDLELVVTAPPQPAGRGRKTRPTPVADWAQNRNVPYLETDNVNTPQTITKISALKPELIVVIAFGQKIGNELINLPTKAAINVHASLLPKYRGAAPINWAIIRGETRTGITIITLAEKMDAGLICSQQSTQILPDETAGQLHDRLAAMAAPLLLKTIEKFDNGSITLTEQDEALVTLAPKIKKSHGFLDFTEPADVIERKIRGLWSWPQAQADYISKKTGKCLRIAIAQAEVIESTSPAGLQLGIFDENLNVICGQNSLKIKKIKPAGGHLMDFTDFVNGRKTCPGDLLLKIEKT